MKQGEGRIEAEEKMVESERVVIINDLQLVNNKKENYCTGQNRRYKWRSGRKF